MMDKIRRRILSRITVFTIGMPLVLAACAHPSRRRRRRHIFGYTTNPSTLVVGSTVDLPNGIQGRVEKITASKITLNIDGQLIKYEYQVS